MIRKEMPPNQQQHLKSTDSHNRTGLPGSLEHLDRSTCFQCPPPSTMNNIQDAFERNEIEEESLESGSRTPPKSNNTRRSVTTFAASASDVADTSRVSSSSQTLPFGSVASYTPLPPSRHVPFLGYMDVNGVLHPDKELPDSSLDSSNDHGKKRAAFPNERNNNS